MDRKYIKKKIKKDIYTYASSHEAALQIMNGINGVELLKNIDVKGGFFALLDYSKIKNKKDRRGNIIYNDKDVFKYLFDEAGIKIIMGSSIGFDTNEMIGRVTFALEKKEIVKCFEEMKKSIEKLI